MTRSTRLEVVGSIPEKGKKFTGPSDDTRSPKDLDLSHLQL